MALSTNDSMEIFAKRMERRATVMQRKVDALVRQRFESIANIIFLYNPVWSSQSVVNWTASIGYVPLKRLVNVDRSNGGNTEGNMSNITPHNQGQNSIAAVAANVAFGAAISVSKKYKSDKDLGSKPKAIWLTNNISYTGKLWNNWPTNKFKGGLSAVVEKVANQRTSIKVWRF